MTIEEMKSRKRELGLTNKMISEKSGVPLSTVQKVFSGFTSAPRLETILALEKVLLPRRDEGRLFSEGSAGWEREKQGTPSNRMSGGDEMERNMSVARVSHQQVTGVRENSALYCTEGPYTLKDYLALPEDQRVELIDGVFYDMAAPTTIHQGLAGMIYKKFLDHVLEHKGPCFPFISPVDVQLDRDDKTVVQPDVMIVCDRDKHKNGRIFGAPDLVVEILSSSTRKKDMQLKLHKYGNAGVREYWMIDPRKRVVVQYDLEHLEPPVIYGFADKVPVLIWDGACVVDFKEVNDAVSFLWEVQ